MRFPLAEGSASTDNKGGVDSRGGLGCCAELPLPYHVVAVRVCRPVWCVLNRFEQNVLLWTGVRK